MSENAHTLRAINSVLEERVRQLDKWGVQSHPDGTGGSWQKVEADKAREICDGAFADGVGSWRLILAEEFHEAVAEDDLTKLREELTHVAAVAVGWIEDIDRRTSE